MRSALTLLFTVPLHCAILESAATARVRGWLSGDATMLPPAALSHHVRFESDCCSISGAEAYSAAAARWHADAHQLLQPFTTTVLRCAFLSEDAVAVRWRAEWEPPALQWAPTLAQLLRWQVERFDVDPTAVSTFRWRSVFKLFARAFATGTLRLPAAAVEGRAELTFDASGERVVRHVETIDLVRTADAGQLYNRRSAQDIAEFLDVARRPNDHDPDEWAAEVRSRVLAGVPGAGVLDVEPNEDESEAPLALAIFGMLTAAGLAISAGAFGGTEGVPFGENEASQVCDSMMASIGATSSEAYSQCVSDLY